MEHKLIDGGEKYLPFARKQIKSLRATGLKYGTQRFQIDDTDIGIRIAGEHDYIKITEGAGAFWALITVESMPLQAGSAGFAGILYANDLSASWEAGVADASHMTRLYGERKSLLIRLTNFKESESRVVHKGGGTAERTCAIVSNSNNATSGVNRRHTSDEWGNSNGFMNAVDSFVPFGGKSVKLSTAGYGPIACTTLSGGGGAIGGISRYPVVWAFTCETAYGSVNDQFSDPLHPVAWDRAQYATAAYSRVWGAGADTSYVLGGSRVTTYNWVEPTGREYVYTDSLGGKAVRGEPIYQGKDSNGDDIITYSVWDMALGSVTYVNMPWESRTIAISKAGNGDIVPSDTVSTAVPCCDFIFRFGDVFSWTAGHTYFASGGASGSFVVRTAPEEPYTQREISGYRQGADFIQYYHGDICDRKNNYVRSFDAGAKAFALSRTDFVQFKLGYGETGKLGELELRHQAIGSPTSTLVKSIDLGKIPAVMNDPFFSEVINLTYTVRNENGSDPVLTGAGKAYYEFPTNRFQAGITGTAPRAIHVQVLPDQSLLFDPSINWQTVK